MNFDPKFVQFTKADFELDDGTRVPGLRAIYFDPALREDPRYCEIRFVKGRRYDDAAEDARIRALMLQAMREEFERVFV